MKMSLSPVTGLGLSLHCDHSANPWSIFRVEHSSGLIQQEMKKYNQISTGKLIRDSVIGAYFLQRRCTCLRMVSPLLPCAAAALHDCISID